MTGHEGPTHKHGPSQVLGQGLDQHQQRLAHGGVGDLAKGVQDAQRLVIIGVSAQVAFWHAHAIVGREQFADLAFECRCNLCEATAGNAVRPLLVFLHLLERDPDRLGEAFLRHTARLAQSPNALADPDVGRIGISSRVKLVVHVQCSPRGGPSRHPDDEHHAAAEVIGLCVIHVFGGGKSMMLLRLAAPGITPPPPAVPAEAARAGAALQRINNRRR
jgi:hypothetical protein